MPKRDQVKYHDSFHQQTMLWMREWRKKNPSYYQKPYPRKGGIGRPRNAERLERLKAEEVRLHQKIEELAKEQLERLKTTEAHVQQKIKELSKQAKEGES